MATRTGIPRGARLRGTNIALRTITRDDYEFIFRVRTNTEDLFLWSHPRKLRSFPDFVIDLEDSLRSYIDTFLIIADPSGQDQMGFVYSYETSPVDGYTFLAIYLAPSFRGSGFWKDALGIFLEYLFNYLNIRKVYMDIFEFNRISIGLAEAYGLKEEGKFPSHRWYGDQYWALHRFALYRGQWKDIKSNAGGLLS